MINKITATDLFLAILALLLTGVSFTQTWIGLEQIFGTASFVIALVLSLLLLFLCWLMRNAKVLGKSTSNLIGIYIFIASFCFIANFNALYTRFMRTDIYVNDLRALNDSFSKLEADMESRLNYKYNKETARNIEIKKKQMMEQIKDPGDPGIGVKAMSLIRDIEQMTGEKIDILSPVRGDYDDLSIRMGRQIDNMIFDLSPDESSLKSDLNNAVLKWNKKIQALFLLSDTEKNALSQGIIDDAQGEYNKLGNRTQLVLGEEKYKFTPFVSKTHEVGKIGFAFEHAIRNFGMYQFVVLMGCILLDFVVVIIIHLVITSDNVNIKSTPIRNKKNIILD